MRKYPKAIVAAVIVLASVLAPMAAQARSSVHIGLGFGYPYPPYYPYYHHHHHRSSVYFGPSLVYAPPPVVYTAAPVVRSSILADQTSPTFVDSYGRTCREYQSNAVYGTACLFADGTWRTVP